jgi:SAM-dependent methyltransferase
MATVDEAQILEQMRAYVREHGGAAAPAPASAPPRPVLAELDIARLDLALAGVWAAKDQVAQLNPRNPGLVNDSIQRGKNFMRRSLGWYTRSFQEFHSRLAYGMQEQNSAVRSLESSLKTLEREIASVRAELAVRLPPVSEIDVTPQRAVTEQLRPYIEYFTGVSDVVDLGCGNGEFLELLRQHNISGYGVTPNRNAREIARRTSLKIVYADIFEHLRQAPERSLGGAFTVGFLERLPTRLQTELLQLIAGRLRPGGVLVIETVGPSESESASHALPADLLQSLLEANGFRDVKIFSLANVECHLNRGSGNGSAAAQRFGECSPTGIYSAVAYRS